MIVRYFFLSSILSATIVLCCVDNDPGCSSWVRSDSRSCTKKDYIRQNCKKSCGNCPKYQPKFDVRRLPRQLSSLSSLVGIWRGSHTGKVSFPTIPTFKYSEEVEFAIPENPRVGSLNYTSNAWSSDNEELHREYGYITIKPNTREILLTTVMSNGFITVESGQRDGNSIKFRLKDIGRISFVRDEHLSSMVREWTFTNPTMMKARLSVETLSHKMSEHTAIFYEKFV